jgi:alkylated DNA nucleotide flippase Atl1
MTTEPSSFDGADQGILEDDGKSRGFRIDDYSSRVLDVVDAIPAGQVMSYGDIAEYLGAGGPRQVGRVLARYGGAAPWWRVTHADGTPAPGHDDRALTHYLAEGTPMRSASSPVRVNMRQARYFPRGDDPPGPPRAGGVSPP